MPYTRYNDDTIEEQFPGLAEDLNASRFPKTKYHPGVLQEWLLVQYERACAHQDMLVDNMAFMNNAAPVIGANDYASLWHHIIETAFDVCKSATAKKAIWGAVALATIGQDNALLVKHAAPLLYMRAKSMPADAKEKRIDIFAGEYSANDYRLTTLVAATQRLQMGDANANEHVRQWLKSICMAPGVLPARKQKASPGVEAKEETRANQVLWWEVVVPFCQTNPNELLLSDKVFPYLPIAPGHETGQHLVRSLPERHQQWAYANILGTGQNPSEMCAFWRQAFPDSLTPEIRDCRLHLAMLQLKPDDAKELAAAVDGPTVAMLETLDSYSAKTMADMLYGRWFSKPQEAPELPKDWYDDTTLGF